MKHTSGAWSAIKPEGAPYWGIHTTASECTVAGTGSGLCEADARLCAASPDLLAALQMVCASGVSLADPIERAMLDAIAKANGP